MGSSESDEELESFGTEIGRRDDLVVQFQEWVLVGGDRIVIALLVTLLGLGFFLALEQLRLVAFVNDDSMTRLASGLTAGTFSLVTLVVSVNQLILSQEFANAGEARNDLEGVRDFRRELAETTDVPAPPASPTKLLELLAEAIHYRADTLAASVRDHDDELRELVVRYTDRVQESSERMDETLEHTEFGSFRAVSAAVRYDSAWQLYVADQISHRHRDALSAGARDALDELVAELELFEIAREHFKTIYLQRELTQFSRLTIYAGVPGIIASITLALLYADVAGPTISTAYLPVVVPVLISIVLFSLGLLLSFILRTATVTRRTASIGPMVPQKDPSEGPFEVSVGDEEE